LSNNIYVDKLVIEKFPFQFKLIFWF